MNTQTGADQDGLLSGREYVFKNWKKKFPLKKTRIVRFPDLEGNQYRVIDWSTDPAKEVLPFGAWSWQYVTLIPTSKIVGDFEEREVEESDRSPMYYYGYKIEKAQVIKIAAFIHENCDEMRYALSPEYSYISDKFLNQSKARELFPLPDGRYFSGKMTRCVLGDFMNSQPYREDLVVTDHADLTSEVGEFVFLHNLKEHDQVLGLLPPWVPQDFVY